MMKEVCQCWIKRAKGGKGLSVKTSPLTVWEHDSLVVMDGFLHSRSGVSVHPNSDARQQRRAGSCRFGGACPVNRLVEDIRLELQPERVGATPAGSDDSIYLDSKILHQIQPLSQCENNPFHDCPYQVLAPVAQGQTNEPCPGDRIHMRRAFADQIR
jgi:hypothetical protein